MASIEWNNGEKIKRKINRIVKSIITIKCVSGFEGFNGTECFKEFIGKLINKYKKMSQSRL